MVDVCRAADHTLHMRECLFIISIYRIESRRGRTRTFPRNLDQGAPNYQIIIVFIKSFYSLYNEYYNTNYNFHLTLAINTTISHTDYLCMSVINIFFYSYLSEYLHCIAIIAYL